MQSSKGCRNGECITPALYVCARGTKPVSSRGISRQLLRSDARCSFLFLAKTWTGSATVEMEFGNHLLLHSKDGDHEEHSGNEQGVDNQHPNYCRCPPWARIQQVHRWCRRQQKVNLCEQRMRQ